MSNGTRKQVGLADDQETIGSEIKLKGYTMRASKQEPQYLINSDKRGHLAIHKPPALKKFRKTVALSETALLVSPESSSVRSICLMFRRFSGFWFGRLKRRR
jgi:hypothetical protein